LKLTITASNKNRLKRGDKASEWFVKSIQWQTFTDFELLIADGGSDNYEDLQDWLGNYDGPIPMRLVQHKIGDVFLRALLNNVGVRNAKAPYIMTTDVDMLYGPKFVETLVGKLGPNVFVESRTMYLKPKAVALIYNVVADPCTNIDDCKRGRIKKRTTAGGCQCTHIDNWSKVRGFDESYFGWGSEDQDLLRRVQKAGIRVRWMGESKKSIMLFHQPHVRPNVKRDLEHQEENKKRLESITDYAVNPDGWGGKKD
jgi:hypothetical protein